VLNDSVGISVIVITHKDDYVASINTVLRDSGTVAHCSRLNQIRDLEKSIYELQPAMLIAFLGEPKLELASVAEIHSRFSPKTPMLVVADEVNEQVIADSMNCGARDVVSLHHSDRFHAVVQRELRSFRLENALEGVLTSASQYKQELRKLMHGSAKAIADVQEGIVVAANPTWLSLFGRKSEDDMVGQLLMDLCKDADRPKLKGALVACSRGKWTDQFLKVAAERADGSELPMEMQLDLTTHDGESAVRVTIASDSSAEKTPEQLIEHAVHRDPVTGFYHRQYFLEKAADQLKKPPAVGVRAIAYIRPDAFGKVHEDIGLLRSEMLLTQLAQLLREFMQHSDVYGRFGGTMFAAVLERGTMNDVEAWAEQVRKSVADQVFEFDDHSTALTCSIGLCEIASPEADIADLLFEADKACGLGRDRGGDCVELSKKTDEKQEIRQNDESWVPKIRSALMENRFQLVHQPIASLNEEIDGAYDTLVRMVDEKNELIPAGQFMSSAERAGLSKMIDRWVINASFEFTSLEKPSMLFVRLSRDSVIDETLSAWLKQQLKESGISAGRVCFEVSEEVVRQHLKYTKSLAKELQRMGFHFAIDHFGTKDDSRQMLSRVPMHFVKIDGSLMQGLHRDTALQKKVQEITAAARKYKIKTIAERVQDANTMAVLWQLDVGFIQGNYVQMHDVILEEATDPVPILSNTA
jgi:diguanylate cyclase (GGDEF)-like protein/PAS domain S-box-containing protein